MPRHDVQLRAPRLEDGAHQLVHLDVEALPLQQRRQQAHRQKVVARGVVRVELDDPFVAANDPLRIPQVNAGLPAVVVREQQIVASADGTKTVADLSTLHAVEERNLLGLLYGLALGVHHASVVLAAPALLLLAWRTAGWRELLRRVAPPVVGGTLLGLLAYLYLPWAAARDPVLNWGDPSSWDPQVIPDPYTYPQMLRIREELGYTEEHQGRNP